MVIRSFIYAKNLLEALFNDVINALELDPTAIGINAITADNLT